VWWHDTQHNDSQHKWHSALNSGSSFVKPSVAFFLTTLSVIRLIAIMSSVVAPIVWYKKCFWLNDAFELSTFWMGMAVWRSGQIPTIYNNFVCWKKKRIRKRKWKIHLTELQRYKTLFFVTYVGPNKLECLLLAICFRLA
jgi:hypothetical protein